MTSRSHTIRLVGLLLVLTLCSGCWKQLIDPLGLFTGGGGDDDERPSVLPDRVTNPTDTLAIAIGGVDTDRDALILTDSNGNPRDFSGQTLECEAEEEDMVELVVRPGYSSIAAGSGVRVIPREAGVTAITCKADGEELDDLFEVTVPPQVFIQILVAEALQQLSDEATLDEDAEGFVVSLGSKSPTGDALGSVIRNRIAQINLNDDPGLFLADEDDYDDDPQASYYEAVIMAEGQFSPTDPGDPNYDLFLDAGHRSVLSDEERVAYDQALLTAAGIFNGDTADTTTGAFAFRSPTQDEWNIIREAWSMHYYDIPDGAGFSDADFPAFAPIQILIHPDVWTYDDSRPSFVFARMRTESDFAVVNSP